MKGKSIFNVVFYRFLVLLLTEFFKIFARDRHFYPDLILNTKYFVSNFVIQNPCSHMSLYHFDGARTLY